MAKSLYSRKQQLDMQQADNENNAQLQKQLDIKSNLDGDIPGTRQVPTSVNGKVVKIQHINKSNIIIREDTYDYTSTHIKETRKLLLTGETKIYITNLSTLEMEVI